VSVVCDQLETDPEDKNAAINPKVLVEVLSDSTEAYDRGEKFAHYRRIPSLQEYVLISQHERFIEVFRKNEAGKWVLAEEARTGEQALLASIECALSVDEKEARADLPMDGYPTTQPGRSSRISPPV
jgi:Uma2 family endonuclease